MKLFCIIALVIAGSTALWSQTNAPVATNNVPVSESTTVTTDGTKKTVIRADSGVANLLSNVVVYRGNVSAVDPQFKLTCEWLTARMVGSQPTNIIATTNVVIHTYDAKNGTIEAVADRAEYVFQVVTGVTNETITLTSLPGNPDPIVRNSKGSQSGRVIIIHPLTGDVESFGGLGEQAETTLSRNSTFNPLARNTNAPARAIANTNLPPAAMTNTNGTNHGK